MPCTCNTCENYDPKNRWCYIYEYTVKPGNETKTTKCRAWAEYTEQVRFIQ